MGLIVADKPDSQDICFVPKGAMPTSSSGCSPDAGAARRHRPPRRPRARPPRGHHPFHHRPAARPRRRRRRAALCRGARCRRRAASIVGPREALATRRLLLRDVNWLGDEPSTDRRRAGATLSPRFARRARPHRHASPSRTARDRSNCSTAKTALRRARPASSMMATEPARASSAAASSPGPTCGRGRTDARPARCADGGSGLKPDPAAAILSGPCHDEGADLADHAILVFLRKIGVAHRQAEDRLRLLFRDGQAVRLGHRETRS